MTASSDQPLRLVHSSDWHIGQDLHGYDRSEEHDALALGL
jgi:hypothetical protein